MKFITIFSDAACNLRNKVASCFCDIRAHFALSQSCGGCFSTPRDHFAQFSCTADARMPYTQACRQFFRRRNRIRTPRVHAVSCVTLAMLGVFRSIREPYRMYVHTCELISPGLKMPLGNIALFGCNVSAALLRYAPIFPRMLCLGIRCIAVQAV